MGIMPEEFKIEDVAVSFSKATTLKAMNEESKQATSFIEVKKLSVYDYLIIPMASPYLSAWSFIHTLCCLTSCYFYAYLAAFDLKNELGEVIVPVRNVYIFFESVFAISFGIQFFVEFQDPQTTLVVRDLKRIALNYIQGNLLWDLVPLLPLAHVLDLGGKEIHLYLFKLMRLFTGLKIFNVSKIMEKIKTLNEKRLNKIIEE